MAKVGGSNKKTLGSLRAKLGLPAKAGRRRPPHLKSVRDRNGHRDWEAVSRPVPKSVSKKKKPEPQSQLES
jgi:hypothetical protein